jgi:outer membrane beta-barrel protein
VIGGGRARPSASLAAAAVLALATVAPVAAAADEPAAGGDPAKETADAGPRDERGVTSMCIDQEIANRLAIKRQRRHVRDRLFLKQARHELAATFGYYVSDLYSATYVAGGSYTYHMTEGTAVELSGAITHADADLIRAIEDERGDIIDDAFARTLMAESLLLWTPVYGKFRLGGSVVHFDLHLDGGFGVVDAQTSRGFSGVGGLGVKVFMGHAFALRFDARDHVHRHELLDESFLVNDLTLTAGVSMFLPLRN